MTETCPFCGRDPFHYVDNGLGMEAVAVTCCDLGVELYRKDDSDTATISRGDLLAIAGKLHQLRTASQPKVIDNDTDEISIELNGEQIRGWSYSNRDEQRLKMRMAHEFAEGWFQAMERCK